MKSGKCPNCGYHFRLRKNGTMGSHRIYGAKVKPGDPYRVAREKQGRVYITDDSYYCEGIGKFSVEYQTVSDKLYEKTATYLERNKDEFEHIEIKVSQDLA